MLAFRTFELVAAIQICIQNLPNFENIFHDIYQKMQQNKTSNGTLTYHFMLISNLTHVAALLFELLLSLHVAGCTFIFRVKMAANCNTV